MTPLALTSLIGGSFIAFGIFAGLSERYGGWLLRLVLGGIGVVIAWLILASTGERPACQDAHTSILRGSVYDPEMGRCHD